MWDEAQHPRNGSWGVLFRCCHPRVRWSLGKSCSGPKDKGKNKDQGFFVLFLVALGFELRASCLLYRYFYCLNHFASLSFLGFLG
jgi:hypothetical protein